MDDKYGGAAQGRPRACSARSCWSTTRCSSLAAHQSLLTACRPPYDAIYPGKATISISTCRVVTVKRLYGVVAAAHLTPPSLTTPRPISIPPLARSPARTTRHATLVTIQPRSLGSSEVAKEFVKVDEL